MTYEYNDTYSHYLESGKILITKDEIIELANELSEDLKSTLIDCELENLLYKKTGSFVNSEYDELSEKLDEGTLDDDDIDNSLNYLQDRIISKTCEETLNLISKKYILVEK